MNRRPQELCVSITTLRVSYFRIIITWHTLAYYLRDGSHSIKNKYPLTDTIRKSDIEFQYSEKHIGNEITFLIMSHSD